MRQPRWEIVIHARLGFALIAAAVFVNAGIQMLDIQSRGAFEGLGSTVDEAFYNAFAYIAFGLAALSLSLAFPIRRASKGIGELQDQPDG